MPKNAFFYRATLFALLLSVAMTSLSAYIRLDDAGFGCTPWPACYGDNLVIDSRPGITVSVEDSNRGLRVLHRLMASVFGIVVLLMMIVTLWYRRRFPVGPLWPTVAFAITMILSVVGMSTPDIHRPVVTAINLAGGMVLAAALFHLALLQRRTEDTSWTLPAGLSVAALCATIALVFTGSWVSGSFAAASCDGFLNCPGYAAGSLREAFDTGRELSIIDGRLEMDAHQPVILLTHQVLATATVALVMVAAGVALAQRGISAAACAAPILAIALFLLALWEGSRPSLATANLHNLFSLLLLMALVLQTETERTRPS